MIYSEAIWDPIEKPNESEYWTNLPYLTPPNKIVEHKTQGHRYPRSTYKEGGGVPHFTVGPYFIWQHYDTDDASRALYNDDGGVSPNRDGTIQIEVIGFSGLTGEDTAHNYVKLCIWLEKTHGIPAVWPMGRPPQNGRLNPAPSEVWLNQPGHYAHSQCPENVKAHWDPSWTDEEWTIVSHREDPMAPPIGNLDRVFDNGDGTVTVQGWALDPDEPSKSIEAHIYVDEQVYGVMADRERADVNEVMSVTGNHGIDAVVRVVDIVNIALYGIDATGDENSFIGSKKLIVQRP